MTLPERSDVSRFFLHYLTLLVWSFWMGGFSLYFGVVIRVGGPIVGDTSQGFVTQGVTWWLNIIGMIAIVIFLCNLLVHRNRFLLVAWTVLLATQLVLFWLHAMLGHLLDPTAQAILEPGRFAVLHEQYEFTSAVQWLCAMLYIGCYAWQTTRNPRLAPNATSLVNRTR